MSFIKLDKLLNKLVKKAGIKNQLDSTDFMNQFKEAGEVIFGEKVMKQIKPMECKDGVLTISCLSSVLADRLKSNEKWILWQLNKAFGKKVVEKVRFLA